MSAFRLPGDNNRLLILGRTGSGKSQAGAWHLSYRDFVHRPWLILDPKEDELLGELGAHHLDLGKKLPKRPGLYITHPVPEVDDDQVSALLGQAMNQRNTGVYVDEGYSLPKNPRAFRRILTQGRSRQVPSIVLSQRPVWIDRFNYSEASFIQMFHLQDQYDRRAVRGFVGFDPDQAVPEFHSHWHDVSAGASFILKPVPTADEIVETFKKRLGHRRAARWF